ncbi:hypothetical protein KY289_013370 [Solanum tuberosum]|nr:hypothetical protein KY289_013370 [Solanum tuberosum]
MLLLLLYGHQCDQDGRLESRDLSVVAIAAPATGEDAATAPAAGEKKEEAKEESDDEAMFSLFD